MSSISSLKTFVETAQASLITNPFSQIPKTNLTPLSENRFNSYLDMTEEYMSIVRTDMDDLDSIIMYLSELNEKSLSNITKIIANEKARVLYATIGKPESENEDKMEIVSMNGFVYSIKDGGWIFE